MAMMISKFNRLITSRFLWIVILTLIVFAFIIWGMQWPSDFAEAEQQNEGRLDGETVSPQEYQAAYLSTYLAYVLNNRAEDAAETNLNVTLRNATWERLATLRMAAKLGIQATDNEVLASIRRSFSDEAGVFYPEQYQAFVQQMLPTLGFYEKHFETLIRQEIAMNKVGVLLGRQALIAPQETTRLYHVLLDEYTLEYATIRPDAVADRVETTTEDARRFYEENPDTFMFPEIRRVAYVRFPFEAYTVDSPLEEDELQDYYDININLFTTTNLVDEVEQVDVADFADVREEIAERLAREKTIAATEQAAMDFTYGVIPARDGTIPEFAKVAEKAELPVTEVEVRLAGASPVPEAGDDFIPSAFALDMNPYDRVSSAVLAEDAAYILYLLQISPPRLPAFEEVEESAMAAANQQAIAAALADYLQELKTAAEEGIAEGKTFAESLERFDVEIKTSNPLAGVASASLEDEESYVLIQTAVGYNQGEVMEPIPLENGMLLAYVKTVHPADPMAYELYRPQINQSVQNLRGMVIFSDWREQLLASGRFEDFRPISTTFDDEEELEIEDGVAEEEF